MLGKDIGVLIIGMFGAEECFGSLAREVVELGAYEVEPSQGGVVVRPFPDAPLSYTLEMGRSLSSCVVRLKGKHSLTRLVDLKAELEALERRFQESNKRKINLNPGIVREDGMYLESPIGDP